MQNEILKVMAHTILRGIANNLQNTEFFTIMMDECADQSNKEQVGYQHSLVTFAMTYVTYSFFCSLDDSAGSSDEMGR